jgi:hypothetical protein
LLHTRLLLPFPSNGRYLEPLTSNGCCIAAYFAVIALQRAYKPRYHSAL